MILPKRYIEIIGEIRDYMNAQDIDGRIEITAKHITVQQRSDLRPTFERKNPGRKF